MTVSTSEPSASPLFSLALVGSATPLFKTASNLATLLVSVSSVNVFVFVEVVLSTLSTNATSLPPAPFTTSAETDCVVVTKPTPSARSVAPINFESVLPFLYLRKEKISRLLSLNILYLAILKFNTILPLLSER